MTDEVLRQPAAPAEPNLREFAREILDDFPDSFPDGFGIQDLAVKHGVLVGETRTKPCMEEGCHCAEYHGDMSEGVTCYRLAPSLFAAAPAAPAPEPVAWMFRYRGRFGNDDWTQWQAIEGVTRPSVEFAECESYPLYAHPATPECKCDLRTKLVGDGCEVCNPELAKELAAPAPRSLRDMTEADFNEALGVNQDAEAILARVRTIVDEQAEDEGLWFAAETVPEAYLQQELRRLHAAIEGEDDE